METPKNKPAARKRLALSKAEFRTRLTNGTDILEGVDGRSSMARRHRDLIALHLSDLGGEDCISEAEYSLLRRAVALTVQLELMETSFALRDGAAAPKALEVYGRVASHIRRLHEALGLPRRQRDITPSVDAYARQVAGERAPA
ncbi:MAG TPA: hypothetical protein VM013_05990 [Dehalococcoidia bacterium]|nr:hypothetical protein [Dehalococcoidia bacterium]